MWRGVGHLHKECPEQGNTASIQTCCNCKLVDGEEPHPSNYRGCRQRPTPRTTATSPQDYPFRWWYAATHSNSCSLSRLILGRPAPPALRHNQQVPSQSVEAPNVNSSSLNEMFKVFQLINGAESDEDRAVAITKIILKFMKKWLNIGDICCSRQMTDLSSRQRWRPTSTEPQPLAVTKIWSWTPPWVWLQDWLIDWLTVCRNVTLILTLTWVVISISWQPMRGKDGQWWLVMPRICWELTFREAS
jgi:hypothetical protein